MRCLLEGCHGACRPLAPGRAGTATSDVSGRYGPSCRFSGWLTRGRRRVGGHLQVGKDCHRRRSDEMPTDTTCHAILFPVVDYNFVKTPVHLDNMKKRSMWQPSSSETADSFSLCLVLSEPYSLNFVQSLASRNWLSSWCAVQGARGAKASPTPFTADATRTVLLMFYLWHTSLATHLCSATCRPQSSYGVSRFGDAGG